MLPVACFQKPLATSEWAKTASPLFDDDRAPSARRVPPGPQAAPAHPGAQPERLGRSSWPQGLASGRPSGEGVSAFTLPQADALLGHPWLTEQQPHLVDISTWLQKSGDSEREEGASSGR